MQPLVLYLEKNYRQNEDSLLDVLNRIRTNQVTHTMIEKLEEKMEYITNDEFHTTKLFTHNVDVDAMNDLHLQQIETPSKVYAMEGYGDKRVVSSIKRGCLAPETLELKVGAAVMFVKNNPIKGYVNGTLGEVVDFNDEGAPIVQLANGKEIVATSENWSMKDGDDVLGEINQIPLRLAWAITIHKSQGMSLDAAEIDLRKCFLPGMGYVALSRVRTFEGMNLKGFNPMALQVDKDVLAFDKTIKK